MSSFKGDPGSAKNENKSQRVSSRISITANLRGEDDEDPKFFSPHPSPSSQPNFVSIRVKRAEIMRMLGHLDIVHLPPTPLAKPTVSVENQKMEVEEPTEPDEPLEQEASKPSTLSIHSPPTTSVEKGPQKEDNKKNAPKPTPTRPCIRVDPICYQAKLEPFEDPSPLQTTHENPLREELIWTNPPESHNFDFEAFRNLYWRAIRRQFQGHVTLDEAMKHLMTKNWSILAALETIDEVLRRLDEPPVTIPMVKCLFLKPMEMDHHVKEEAADWDTYKIRQPDCIEFFHFWHRSHIQKTDPQSSDPLTKPLDFEPRWSCSNCTKAHLQYRRTSLRLCLICQTYEQLSGGRPRPLSTDPHFYEYDLSQMRDWRAMEAREKREISREEFEKEQENEETQRLEGIRKMKNPRRELPREQVEMVKRFWNLMIGRAKRVNKRRPALNRARGRFGKDPLPMVAIPAKFKSLDGEKFAELLERKSWWSLDTMTSSRSLDSEDVELQKALKSEESENQNPRRVLQKALTSKASRIQNPEASKLQDPSMTSSENQNPDDVMLQNSPMTSVMAPDVDQKFPAKRRQSEIDQEPVRRSKRQCRSWFARRL